MTIDTAPPTADMLRARLMCRLFAGPLLQNNVRSEYVEEMVAVALEPDWGHCVKDWAAWDLENNHGQRIQVKQSAKRQSWPSKRPNPGSYDISTATGHWRGSEWIAKPGRQAEIYVLAWHDEHGDTANHTNPKQWVFFVLPEKHLPQAQKTISLSALVRRTPTPPVAYASLKERVTAISESLLDPSNSTH